MSDAEAALTSTETPTLYESLSLLQDYGLVGEEENGVCLAILMPMGGAMCVYGPAATGKTWMLERVQKLYGKASAAFYEMPTTSSPTALFYDADRANAHAVHIWPDIAELPSEWEGVMKRGGEQKTADRRVTNVTIDDVDSKVINPPRSMPYLLASNNKRTDIHDYEELLSRSILFSMDSSAEQTQRILEAKAQLSAGLVDPQVGQDREDAILSHFAQFMGLGATFWELGQGRVLNPVMPELIGNGVLPTLFPEARRDFEKLERFVNAVAVYHYQDRIRFIAPDGTPTIVVAPEDVWLAMKVYGERMVMSALSLTRDDLAILTYVRSVKSALSVTDIRQGIATTKAHGGPGLNLTTPQVRKSLDTMADIGYITVNTNDTPYTYQPGFFASQVDHSMSLPWGEIVESAAENAAKALPMDKAEEYVRAFCTDPAAIHPFTGEVVSIVDDTEFETGLAEAAADVNDALSQPLWGGETESDSATEPESGANQDQDHADAEPPAEQLQGTL